MATGNSWWLDNPKLFTATMGVRITPIRASSKTCRLQGRQASQGHPFFEDFVGGNIFGLLPRFIGEVEIVDDKLRTVSRYLV